MNFSKYPFFFSFHMYFDQPQTLQLKQINMPYFHIASQICSQTSYIQPLYKLHSYLSSIQQYKTKYSSDLQEENIQTLLQQLFAIDPQQLKHREDDLTKLLNYFQKKITKSNSDFDFDLGSKEKFSERIRKLYGIQNTSTKQYALMIQIKKKLTQLRFKKRQQTHKKKQIFSNKQPFPSFKMSTVASTNLDSSIHHLPIIKKHSNNLKPHFVYKHQRNKRLKFYQSKQNDF